MRWSKKLISLVMAAILTISGMSLYSVSAATGEENVAAGSLTVTATSNYFPTTTQTFDSSTKLLTVTYYINLDADMLNTQWELTYDPAVLQYNSENNTTVTDFMPCAVSGSYANAYPIDYTTGELLSGKIYGNCNSINFNKLQSTDGSDIGFVTVTFDVIGSGATNVDLLVNVLTLGERVNNTISETLLVDKSETVSTTVSPKLKTSVYEGAYISGSVDPTQATKPGLKVTAKSNFFPTSYNEFTADTDTITVTYYINSKKMLLDSQWSLTYDPEVLKYNSDKNQNVTDFMPCATSGTFSTTNPIDTETGEPISGMICGTTTNLKLDALQKSDGKDVAFVTVTFDVIGSGETTVNLDLEILTVANRNQLGKLDSSTEESIVNHGTVCDYQTPITTSTRVYAGLYSDEGTTTQPQTTEPTTAPTIEYLYGDTDLNGIISVKDGTIIQKHLAKSIHMSELQQALADVTGDGQVSVKDVTLIQKYLADTASGSIIGTPYKA